MGEENKLLLPWGESTVLGATLRNILHSNVQATLLVTGYDADSIAAIAAAFDVPTIHNPDYDAGDMLSSLQVAVRALRGSTDAVLVVLGDQPMVPEAVYDSLLAAYEAHEDIVVAPMYRGQRGNPVLIDSRLFDELLALPWGQAPRALLRRYPKQVRLVPVTTVAVVQDLDRPQEYSRQRPPAEEE